MILKLLYDAEKGIETDFRFYLSFGQKVGFCVQDVGTKSTKNTYLQHKISEALWWRAMKPGDVKTSLGCREGYRDGFSILSFLWTKRCFCVQDCCTKSTKNTHLQHKISEALRCRAMKPDDFKTSLGCREGYRDGFSILSSLWTKSCFLCPRCWHKMNEKHTFAT